MAETDMTPIHYRETQHGFEYGAATVERIMSYERGKGKGRWVVIGIKPTGDEKHSVEVYVSPKGRSVRIFCNGKELVCKPLNEKKAQEASDETGTD